MRIGSGDEHGNIQAVPDLVHGLAEEQVADQAMAVRADHQQVDRLALELADELGMACRGRGP